jgi:hypothetical protein
MFRLRAQGAEKQYFSFYTEGSSFSCTHVQQKVFPFYYPSRNGKTFRCTVNILRGPLFFVTSQTFSAYTFKQPKGGIRKSLKA